MVSHPMFVRRHPCWWMVAAVLAGAAGCSSSTTPEGGNVGLAPDLKLRAMTESQRKAFCDLAASPNATCSESSDAGAGRDPAQDCLSYFSMLPDCTVATFDACLQEAATGDCASTAGPACAALASCPPQSAPSNGVMTYEKAYDTCDAELAWFTLGIGNAVWKSRMNKDGAKNYAADGTTYVGSVKTYCVDYSMFCDHYSWQQGCLCSAIGRYRDFIELSVQRNSKDRGTPEYKWVKEMDAHREVCP